MEFNKWALLVILSTGFCVSTSIFYEAGIKLANIGLNNDYMITYQNICAGFWRDNPDLGLVVFNRTNYLYFDNNVRLRLPRPQDPSFGYMSKVHNLRTEMAMNITANVDPNNYERWTLWDFVMTFGFFNDYVLYMDHFSIRTGSNPIYLSISPSAEFKKLMSLSNAVDPSRPLPEALNVGLFHKILDFLKSLPTAVYDDYASLEISLDYYERNVAHYNAFLGGLYVGCPVAGRERILPNNPPS